MAGFPVLPTQQNRTVPSTLVIESIQIAEYTKTCIIKHAEGSGISWKRLADLCAFPRLIHREAGYQLDKVQNGREPDDWKPMTMIGSGVQEIRIQDEVGAFRVIYVAKFASTVYVLHCFGKKTQKTGKQDLDLALKRYRDLVQELEQ